MAQAGPSDWDIQRNTLYWNDIIVKFEEKYLRVILKREVDPAKLLQGINNSGWKPKRHDEDRIKDAAIHGYNDLDVSILYSLIRNVPRLNPPSRGWSKKPYDIEVTESDDIERVRFLRNELSHKKNLSNIYYLEAFKTLWLVADRALSRTPNVPFQEDLNCFSRLITALEKSTAPHRPKDEGSTANSINISWTHQPDPNIDYVAGYEIYYKRAYLSDRSNKWFHVYTKNIFPKFTIRRLKSHTEYVFKVRALYNKEGNDSVGPFGCESDCIKTKETPANKIGQHCTRVLEGMGAGSNVRYLEVLLDEKVVKGFLRIRRLDPRIDIGQNSCRDSKTILLVGAESSETEKSAFINAVLNLMYDVSFDDDFRLMINKGSVEQNTEARCITQYVFPRLHGAKTKFGVNIVDIPCLTGDLQKDAEITELVRRYYGYCENSFMETLDLIGYVISEGNMQSFGPEQEYILRCVLNIFGTDLKSNVHIIQTSSSPSQNPHSPVVKALHNLHILCKQFRFNNTWLNTYSEDSARNYWEMSVSTFHEFTLQLGRLRPKTVVQSQEALKILNIIRHIFWSHHPLLRSRVNILISLHDEKKAVERSLNADTTVFPIFECCVDDSWDTLNDALCYNCNFCNVSCLYPCYNDCNNLGIINRIHQTCEMCNCPVAIHEFARKFYRLELKKVFRTIQDVKVKYNMEDSSLLYQHIKKLQNDQRILLLKLIHDMDKKFILFQEKSARGHVVPIDNAIDFLIQEELFESSVGSKERIELYSVLKRKKKSD